MKHETTREEHERLGYRAALLEYHGAVKAFFDSCLKDSDNYVGGLERMQFEAAYARAESWISPSQSGWSTRQKWMVVLERDGEWYETEFMGDTESETTGMLKILRKNAELDIHPEQWTEARSRVVPCTLILQLPAQPGNANP